MKKYTQKKTFLVNEIQNGVVLFSTPVSAVSYKSLWHSSLMRRILLNKSFDSILDIKEVKKDGACSC